MSLHNSPALLLTWLLLSATASFSVWAETRVFDLYIKDHLFNPATLIIPADEKVKIIINNLDPTPEEFESFSLNREKVILGQSKGVVFVGPLLPGEYPFFGEFNPNSAQGVLQVIPLADWQELKGPSHVD